MSAFQVGPGQYIIQPAASWGTLLQPATEGKLGGRGRIYQYLSVYTDYRQQGGGGGWDNQDVNYCLLSIYLSI